MNFARLGAGFRFHAPEAAGSVDVSPVRNEKNFLAIGYQAGLISWSYWL